MFLLNFVSHKITLQFSLPKSPRKLNLLKVVKIEGYSSLMNTQVLIFTGISISGGQARQMLRSASNTAEAISYSKDRCEFLHVSRVRGKHLEAAFENE